MTYEINDERYYFCLTCPRTGETQEFVLCQKHANEICPVAPDTVMRDADPDCQCEACDHA